MTRGQTGNKPLSDLMMTQFADAYMHHLAAMSYQRTISGLRYW